MANAKNKMIPKLRFKDANGNDYPDWEERELGEVIKEISEGGTPPTINKDFFGGEINWIVIQDIKDEIYKTSNTLTEEGLKRCSSNLWMPETIILSTGATIGRVGITKVMTATKQGICGIVVNELILNVFLKYWFVKNEVLLNRFAQGSTFKEIRPDTIKKFKIELPCKEEQQKIASFLSSVDEKIQQLNKKKSLLEDYKKGIMQRIFSQELRFKDANGNNYPEWEEKKLGEVLKTISTRPHQIKSSNVLVKGKYRVVDQGKKKIAGYSNEDDKLLQNNGVIVFGDHTTILKFIDFDFIVGADGTKLLTTDNHNLKYLYYNILFNNVNSEGYKRHFSILKSVTLQLPSIEEQQKIANFLSAIDAKIELVGKQKEKTQAYKKGLLQRMFV